MPLEKLVGMDVFQIHGDLVAFWGTVNNKIIITGSNGTFVTIKAGKDFEILSKNKLDDSFHASPAIIGDEIYLRGFKYLYCISSSKN